MHLACFNVGLVGENLELIILILFSRCWENKACVSIRDSRIIMMAEKLILPRSATIDYLKQVVDKVAFFYCKRDEHERRDRLKILLTLIKQLACPNDSSKFSIHTDALEAYRKEQLDPCARRNLPLNTSRTLLAQLVEHYQHPVIILDALDECSREERGVILQDMLSILQKSTCPLKVFVASRHSLDISDHLQGLRHICIQAQDNAKEIENYVKTELRLRVQDKKLLRGIVSRELKKRIRKTLIWGANGM